MVFDFPSPVRAVWCALVRKDLQSSGESAIRMMSRNALLEPSTVLVALSSAGLLNEATTADRVIAKLRTTVLAAVREHPEVVQSAIARVIFPFQLDPAEDEINALHGTMAVAGIINALPSKTIGRQRLQDELLREQAKFTGVETSENLAKAAHHTCLELKIRANHPAFSLLSFLARKAPSPRNVLPFPCATRTPSELGIK